MSPLDATTPRELFGDALDDPRALKRAYARLIKEHSPEAAPEAFRRIRELYEAAQATGAAADPAPVVVDPPVAAPEVEPSTLALLDEGGLDHALGVLKERALRGHPTAVGAYVGLVAATRPDLVPSTLAELAAAPESAQIAVDATRALLDVEGSWSECDALTDIVDACASPEAAAVLAGHWIQRTMARGRPAAAWEAWRRWEPLVHRHQPRAWGHLLLDLLSGFGMDEPEADTRAWLARACATGSPLPDEAVAWLRREVRDQVVIRRAQEAAPEDAVLLDTLVGLRDRSPTGRVQAVVAIAGIPGVRERHAEWVRSAPQLASLLEGWLEGVSHRRAQLWALAGGTPLDPPTISVEALRGAIRRELEAARERRAAAELRETQARTRARRQGQWVILAVILGFGLLALAMYAVAAHAAPPPPGVQAGSGVGVGVMVVLYIILRLARDAGSRTPSPPPAEARPAPSPLPELVQNASTLVAVGCRQTGLYPHEAAIALGADGAALDAVVLDPLSDLDAIGVAHIRRTLQWATG